MAKKEVIILVILLQAHGPVAAVIFFMSQLPEANPNPKYLALCYTHQTSASCHRKLLDTSTVQYTVQQEMAKIGGGGGGGRGDSLTAGERRNVKLRYCPKRASFELAVKLLILSYMEIWRLFLEGVG